MLCSARMPPPAWVIVYTGNATDTAMLYSLLEAEEIPVRIGDEIMGTLAPYAVGSERAAAVKVLVPEDRIEEAEEVVNEFVDDVRAQADTPSPSFRPWTCPCCHEQNDGTFDICWNCQAERSTE